jgi:glutaredoxin 3
MSQVTVYVTNYCPYCDAAKRWLNGMNISYETIDVTNDPEGRMSLLKRSGMRTVPQVFVGDASVGGYQEMRALDNKGGFRPLLDTEGISYTA